MSTIIVFYVLFYSSIAVMYWISLQLQSPFSTMKAHIAKSADGMLDPFVGLELPLTIALNVLVIVAAGLGSIAIISRMLYVYPDIIIQLWQELRALMLVCGYVTTIMYAPMAILYLAYRACIMIRDLITITARGRANESEKHNRDCC